MAALKLAIDSGRLEGTRLSVRCCAETGRKISRAQIRDAQPEVAHEAPWRQAGRAPGAQDVKSARRKAAAESRAAKERAEQKLAPARGPRHRARHRPFGPSLRPKAIRQPGPACCCQAMAPASAPTRRRNCRVPVARPRRPAAASNWAATDDNSSFSLAPSRRPVASCGSTRSGRRDSGPCNVRTPNRRRC